MAAADRSGLTLESQGCSGLSRAFLQNPPLALGFSLVTEILGAELRGRAIKKKLYQRDQQRFQRQTVLS